MHTVYTAWKLRKEKELSQNKNHHDEEYKLMLEEQELKNKRNALKQLKSQNSLNLRVFICVFVLINIILLLDDNPSTLQTFNDSTH